MVPADNDIDLIVVNFVFAISSMNWITLVTVCFNVEPLRYGYILYFSEFSDLVQF